MTNTPQSFEQLLATLQARVDEVLVYFAGPGGALRGKAGEWGPREVLAHFLIWHQSTIEGMESVARGGPPLQVTLPLDEANAQAVAHYAGRELRELVSEARSLQGRLSRAARDLKDIDDVVLVRANGARLSGRQRLQIIADHWAEHLAELRR